MQLYLLQKQLGQLLLHIQSQVIEALKLLDRALSCFRSKFLVVTGQDYLHEV